MASELLLLLLLMTFLLNIEPSHGGVVDYDRYPLRVPVYDDDTYRKLLLFGSFSSLSFRKTVSSKAQGTNKSDIFFIVECRTTVGVSFDLVRIKGSQPKWSEAKTECRNQGR